VAAARLLLSYAIGSPARQEPPDPDRVELEALKLEAEHSDAVARLKLENVLGGLV
jgi:hypothetical protein